MKDLLVAFGAEKFFFYIIGSAIGWLLAHLVRKWASKKCRFTHKKRYVKLELFTNWACPSAFHMFHGENEWWATAATWLCDDCPKHGVDCLDTIGWWKIEHGRVIRDDKAIVSPDPNLKSPAETMREKRAKEQVVRRDQTLEQIAAFRHEMKREMDDMQALFTTLQEQKEKEGNK